MVLELTIYSSGKRIIPKTLTLFNSVYNYEYIGHLLLRRNISLDPERSGIYTVFLVISVEKSGFTSIYSLRLSFLIIDEEVRVLLRPLCVWKKLGNEF